MRPWPAPGHITRELELAKKRPGNRFRHIQDEVYRDARITMSNIRVQCFPLQSPMLIATTTSTPRVVQRVAHNGKRTWERIYYLLGSEVSPSRAHLIASMRFDFPAPLGPITAVKSLKGPIFWIPEYDLKFSTSIRTRRPMVVVKMCNERARRVSQLNVVKRKAAVQKGPHRFES